MTIRISITNEEKPTENGRETGKRVLVFSVEGSRRSKVGDLKPGETFVGYVYGAKSFVVEEERYG
jgi:hypothetical protein